MPENASHALKQIEILLVEGNPNDVELTLHAFEQQHLADRLQVVRDGAEALEVLFATGPYAGRNCLEVLKLILLDLKLPKVSGIEVLRKIRADRRTQQIPVVVITEFGEERDLEESYRLGISQYIVKPVEFGRFTELVARLGYHWLLINEEPAVPQELVT